MVALSNADALLVAVPMIGILVIGHFRLDELVGKPRRRSSTGRGLAAMDAKGQATCVDPDGTAGQEGSLVQPVKAVNRRPRPRADLS